MLVFFVAITQTNHPERPPKNEWISIYQRGPSKTYIFSRVFIGFYNLGLYKGGQKSLLFHGFLRAHGTSLGHTRTSDLRPCHWFEPLCRWHSQVHITSRKNTMLTIFFEDKTVNDDRWRYTVFAYAYIYIYRIYVVYVYIYKYVDPFGGLRNLLTGDIHVISFQLMWKVCSCSSQMGNLPSIILGAENKRCERK